MKALDFFVSTAMGSVEKAEDIDHLRFLENDIGLKFSMVESDSISVDTPKDLDFVREKMKERLDSGAIPPEIRGGYKRGLSIIYADITARIGGVAA